MNNKGNTQQFEALNVKSDNLDAAEHSFSFDQNDPCNNTMNGGGITLNKANYLTYDKKVKAFKNIHPEEDQRI